MVMPLVMVIKVDKQGRVVLPKDIRDRYHFEPNTELCVIEKGDGIEIKVAKQKVPLKQLCSPGLKYDPKKALALDVANMDDDLSTTE
jgi:AbrB family looped-hinge helix DNA binding protein